MKINNTIFCVVCIVCCCIASVYCQTGTENPDTIDSDDPLIEESEEERPEGPTGFRNIELGMQIDNVKDILIRDPFFDYKGNPDVSFLPSTNQVLIECAGNSFIDRAYFQFHDEKLFIIIIELNRMKLDYYTLFTTLSEKYLSSDSLDPTEAIWLFPQVRMSLEKPLTIKYIDIKVFNDIKEKSKAEEDINELSKEEFLKDF